MGDGLILLADGTASNKIQDKDSKTRPPEVSFDNHFGVKMPKVAGEGGSWMEWSTEERAVGGYICTCVL